MLNGAHGGTRLLGERMDVEVRSIGERICFEITPELFGGIDLKGMGWQVDGADVRFRSEERLYDARTMRLQPIPDQDLGRGRFPFELAEEGVDTWRVYVDVGVRSKLQLHTTTSGGDAHGGVRGDLLMGSCALLENGRDIPRMPGAAHQPRH